MDISSREHFYLAPGQVHAIEGFNAASYDSLEKIGIAFRDGVVQDMANSSTLFNCMKHAMDAIQPTITTGSMATPIQFLQAWLPGFVYIMTQARKIDDLVGLMGIGDWADQEIVQGVLERTGTAVPYGDLTNVTYANWNVNFERRTIVKFEEGMMVGREEEATAAKMRVDSASAKRQAAALNLEIIRNSVGFVGYNSGLNRTYGFLNDPNLPNYVNVPNGASGFPQWSKKTYLEIVADINTGIAALQNNSGDTIDPQNTDIILGVATADFAYLNTSTDFGYSVRKWLTDTYPRVKVVSAPQLNAANGGANVFYLYAVKVEDDSSDGGKVFIQGVPTKFLTLGVEQKVKGYQEGYSNATAGIMLKRPYAVVRYSGI